MSEWKFQIGIFALVLASLLEVVGVGALALGALCIVLFWLNGRHGPQHQGEPAIFAVIGLALLGFGVPAFLGGFLVRRWLTPRVHRDDAA